MEAVLSLLILIAGAYFTVIWLKALGNSSGDEPCPPGECKTCPFPCEKRIDESEDTEK